MKIPYHITLADGQRHTVLDEEGMVEFLVLDRGPNRERTILGSDVPLSQAGIDEIQATHPHLQIYTCVPKTTT